MGLLAVFNSAAFATTSGLAIAANATVEVRRESDSGLAQIYADTNGNTAITNPSAFADASGRIKFYTEASIGGFSIKITSGAENWTLRNVPIGTAAEYDVDDFMLAGALNNLTITASVAASALTIALKTNAGVDPSITDKISIQFRKPTLTAGGYDVLTLTAAESLVVSSGSTLGTVSTLPHRLYIFGINDGGTFRLGILNPYDATANAESLLALNQGDLQSATAEGGVGAADSTQVLYSDAAVTTKAVVLLGYIESTQATAGTWATAVSKIALMRPGMLKTGDLVQTKTTTNNTVQTGSTAIPSDDTIPQNTEGTEFIARSITPKSAINILQISCDSYAAPDSGAWINTALFQDATASALRVVTSYQVTATGGHLITLRHDMKAGTESSTTFKIRSGRDLTGSLSWLGANGNRQMGGAGKATLKVSEVFV